MLQISKIYSMFVTVKLFQCHDSGAKFASLGHNNFKGNEKNVSVIILPVSL